MQKFSIILPVRNGGAYVKECIQSILNQTYTGFNCIVLDNSSTDGTLEWISSLKDERIQIIPAERSLSIEENWSRIRAVSKNEFMTMIGHDDILKPNYLAEMNALILRHPDARLYQAHYKYIDKDGRATRDCLPMDEIQKAHEFLACQMNGTINSTGTGYIMRSHDFDEAGGMPGRYPNLIFSDFELWIRLMSKGYKATTLSECFYYREHLSVSRVTNGELYQRAFEVYIDFIGELKKSSDEFALVIERYGSKFLLSFCESLSHRLLKTPAGVNQMRVADLIKKFSGYADLLIPGQQFRPLEVKRIRYAYLLDSSPATRNAFRMIRKVISKKP